MNRTTQSKRENIVKAFKKPHFYTGSNMPHLEPTVNFTEKVFYK